MSDAHRKAGLIYLLDLYIRLDSRLGISLGIAAMPAELLVL
jgi:hypothetical protein